MRKTPQKLILSKRLKLNEGKKNRKFLKSPPVKIYTSRNINSMIIILSKLKNIKLCKEIEIVYHEQHYSNAEKVYRGIHQNS